MRNSNHGNSDTHGMINDAGSVGANHGKTMDQLLTQNTKLSDKDGQCLAAPHVSKNLVISFASLKSDMTGTGRHRPVLRARREQEQGDELGKIHSNTKPKNG